MELRGSGDLTKFMTCLPWREFCSWFWTGGGNEKATRTRRENDPCLRGGCWHEMMATANNGEKALRSTLSPKRPAFG
jgi:hypothetical protein